MTLKLRQLQDVVNETVGKAKIVDVLKESVLAATGFSINSTADVDYVCYQINEILDVSEQKGEDVNLGLKTSLLKKLQESHSFEARKLAARSLPLNVATSMRFDVDPSVRAAVCRRLPVKMLLEVTQRYPNDFEVHHILEAKKKQEAAKKKMGDASRPLFQAELSDTWYADKARRFLDDYGTNIEYQWEEPLIQRYCSSLKATSGIDLDVDKFYKILMKIIDEKHEDALTDSEIRKMRKMMRERGISESADYEAHSADQVEDVLRSITNSKESNVSFLKRVDEVLSIKRASLPAAIMKYRIADGEVSIPLKGIVPGGKLTPLAEQALDTYVSKWNALQEQRGEPLKLSWNPDPGSAAGITFSVILR